MFENEHPTTDIILIDGLMFKNASMELLTKAIMKYQINNKNLRIWSIGKLLPIPLKYFADDHGAIGIVHPNTLNFHV